MANVPTVKESAGVQDTDFVPAAVGDKLPNNGRTRLWVKNLGLASATVTFEAAFPCSHGFFDDHALTVAPGSIGISQEMPLHRFAALVAITYSDPTDLQVVGVVSERYEA